MGALYICFFPLLKLRRIRFLTEMRVFLPSIFLVGVVLLSSLIEVNLGTSFRHRSVILIPLIFIYMMTNLKNKSTSSQANEKNKETLNSDILRYVLEILNRLVHICIIAHFVSQANCNTE